MSIRKVHRLVTILIAGTAVAQVQWTPHELRGRFSDPVAYDDLRARLVQFTGGTGIQPVPETWEWDGSSWLRRLLAASPPSRTGHALAYDFLRGRTVLFGGAGMRDTWEWDGNNWQLVLAPTSPPARIGPAMAYDLLRGRVVLFGGSESTFFGFTYFADTWEWDGANWSLRTPATSPSPRAWHSMAYDLPHARVVLFGGESPLGLRGDTWEWDGANWSQRAVSPAPPARSRAPFACDLSRGRCVLFGGQAQGATAADTWEWDGSSWSQSAPAASPAERTDGGLAYDSARGVMLLASGRRGSLVHGDLWQWNGSQWLRVAEAAAPSERHSAAVAYDRARGRLLVFGGNGATATLGDFWEWDGARWNELLSPSLPSQRSRGAMVFDSLRGRTVMFGGELPGFTNETWDWDGATWRLVATSGPDPRIDFALAFDSARSRVVLFGGLSSPPSPRGDTWEWDGFTWLQRTPAVAPTSRSAHAMAFDERRAVTVLFGGAGAGFGSLLGDTWEWDGVTWQQRFPQSAPGPRAEPAMTYDGARQRVVVFGGGYSPQSDTWDWDGIEWLQRFPAASPPARARHDLVYDPVHEAVVLFGGSSNGPNFADTWELAAVQTSTLSAYGAGCATSAGTLRLEAGTRPWLGDTLTLRLLPLPPSTPTLFVLGSSQTTWSGVSLPLPLDPIGMPGCLLLVSLDTATFVLGGAGAAEYPIVVPVQAALLGAAFYVQGIALDSTANVAGLVTSNALAGLVGSR